MVLSREVKDFIKNTLILTLFFTLVLHLSWGYIAPMLGQKSQAGANDLNFQNANINYLGNIATATSISIGQKEKTTPHILGDASIENISIAEVLTRPTTGQQKLIANNMMAISSYASLLSTDILRLLDNAPDRSTALNEHIALLKNYGKRTEDRIQILSAQIADLGGIVSSTTDTTTKAKAIMQGSYSEYDYTGVDSAIASYIAAKDQENRARIYLVYLENFRKSYLALQNRNLKLLDTITTNRDALIKRATVVIPDSGSDIVKQLKLIQTEAEYRESQNSNR